MGQADQMTGGVDAVESRHPNVHDDDVGPQLAGCFHRLDAVGGLTDNVEVGFGAQDHPVAGPDQALVIGEQDPDHGVTVGSGREAVTSKPPSGRWPACRSPPNRATRSRMPRIPNPSLPSVGRLSPVGAVPSSATVTFNVDPSTVTDTCTDRADVCLRMLVRASCTIRYAVMSMPGGRLDRSPATFSSTLVVSGSVA